MAEISSYTNDTTINDGDRIIGSDSANSNVTRNFRMDDISDYVRGNIVIGDIGDVTATEYAILDGATVTTSELNVLDGVTATTAEINILDGVTATTTEINYLDGVTSAIQTQLDGKGTVSSLGDLSITATATELNIMDGVTATTTELNYVDGVTSSIQTQINNIDQFEPSNTGSANQLLTRTATGYSWQDAADVSYTLPAATASNLGGVIVELSSDIDIDSSGKLTLGNLSTNKITSGVLPQARYADVTASKIDSETATDNYVLTADGSGGSAWEAVSGIGHTIQGDGTDFTTRTNLDFKSPLTVTDNSTDDATEIGLTLVQSDLPNLSAAKTTTGVFNYQRLSSDTPSDGQVLSYRSSDSSTQWVSNVTTTITGTDPTFTLNSNETAADNNIAGRIDFKALNDADTPEEITYGFIMCEAEDVTDGSENGRMILGVRDGIDSDGNRIDIGGSSGTSVSITVDGHTTHSFSQFGLTIESSASAGVPGLLTLRNSDTSPENGEEVGEIRFDSGSALDPEVANIVGILDDVTNDAEHGSLSFQVADAGTENTEKLRIRSGNTYSANPIRLGGDTTSNEFDDYEEGTWSPTALNFTATDNSMVFTNNNSKYTKIGNIVTCFFDVTIPANTDTSGILFTSLPFSLPDFFNTLISSDLKTEINGVRTNQRSYFFTVATSGVEVYSGNNPVSYDDHSGERIAGVFSYRTT